MHLPRGSYTSETVPWLQQEDLTLRLGALRISCVMKSWYAGSVGSEVCLSPRKMLPTWDNECSRRGWSWDFSLSESAVGWRLKSPSHWPRQVCISQHFSVQMGQILNCSERDHSWNWASPGLLWDGFASLWGRLRLPDCEICAHLSLWIFVQTVVSCNINWGRLEQQCRGTFRYTSRPMLVDRQDFPPMHWGQVATLLGRLGHFQAWTQKQVWWGRSATWVSVCTLKITLLGFNSTGVSQTWTLRLP